MIARLSSPAHFLLALALLITTTPLFAAPPTKAKPKTISHPTAVKPKPVPMLKEFSFRGNRIGEDAETVIRRSIKPDSQKYCLGDLDKPGLISCSDGDVSGLPRPNYETWLYYEFFEHQLSGFKLHFHANDFMEISTMLIGKYGEPHHVENNTVQTYTGASADQVIYIWNTAYGPLKLYYHYPDLTSGFLKLENVAVEKKNEALKTQEQQEKGKVVF